MKLLLFTAIALAALGGGCLPSAAPAPSPQPEVPAATAPTPAPTPTKPPTATDQKKPAATVEITDNAFGPKQLAIGVGDTVVWVNNGKFAHTVKGLADVLLFDSGNLMPGKTFQHTFTQPGVYKYTCGIHPEMTGEIIVGEVMAR